MKPFLILLYHHCHEQEYTKRRPDKKLFVDKDTFASQIIWLKENFKVSSLDELEGFSLSKPTDSKPHIFLTFDDGHKDNYDFAFPILCDYKIPATIYLTTSWIDQPSWQWRAEVFDLIEDCSQLVLINIEGETCLYEDAFRQRHEIYLRIADMLVRKSPADRKKLMKKILEINGKKFKDRREEFLNWRQISEMRDSSLMLFGAHTHTHPMLTRLTDSDAFSEIVISKNEIEREIGEKVKHFAYPYGGSNAAGKREFLFAKRAGFITATTAIPPGCRQKNYQENIFSLSRLSIDGRWSLSEFKANVTRQLKV